MLRPYYRVSDFASADRLGSYRDLGMDAGGTCLEFLGMKGVVWEFAPGGSFTTHTGSTPRRIN